MAFNITSQAGRLLKAVGSYTELACGIDTLSGGTVTVTVPALKRVDGVVCSSQSSTNVVYPSATSTNTFTLTGTGADVVMWIAWGIPVA